ncbi:voltage-dependent calcium channel gamma-1 subunit isoform X1 [Oryzias melastigma]|uniref:voltage-dependent calcium channel gamma-1 subunit isoform X1 n=1 Tax=Oryzias melastigma TaxID=30732 RepID=UPI00168CC1A7|nr:voltage-dependent calcium channel gamma-1 subunit isoform X1 [Oryzias melastigma]
MLKTTHIYWLMTTRQTINKQMEHFDEIIIRPFSFLCVTSRGFVGLAESFHYSCLHRHTGITFVQLLLLNLPRSLSFFFSSPSLSHPSVALPVFYSAAKNCSYFKHFTSGEEAEVFEVKTQKEYNISAAAIAIFSLFFMILGTLCVIFSFGKTRDYLLRPAGMFFAFAGLCIIISVEVMRQSVKRMIDSDETIWIEYYYSWSFTCACASFMLLILGGVALLLISMPHMPRNPWETCMDAEADTLD